ncbi:DUF6484 domain-containing protein [Hyalangium versicolor]|uniref:DUF6484 domain-containing protein n=1 Tax=Hyalangium versicolor TaxID=2861190 RepID=UPI001CCBA2D9|nr:DUF6484 domain-containing protein [Hyalangium versicolor]
MTARRSSLGLSPVSPAPALPAAILGWITDYDSKQGAIVDFPGNPAGPVPARLLIDTGARALRSAAASRCPVALLFENGDPSLPLLVGLVWPQGEREAQVDGERIILTGEKEIELRCGDASISLSRNGKIVIRGAYVETRAKGTNRIKGGAVQIN